MTLHYCEWDEGQIHNWFLLLPHTSIIICVFMSVAKYPFISTVLFWDHTFHLSPFTGTRSRIYKTSKLWKSTRTKKYIHVYFHIHENWIHSWIPQQDPLFFSGIIQNSFFFHVLTSCTTFLFENTLPNIMKHIAQLECCYKTLHFISFFRTNSNGDIQTHLNGFFPCTSGVA